MSEVDVKKADLYRVEREDGEVTNHQDQMNSIEQAVKSELSGVRAVIKQPDLVVELDISDIRQEEYDRGFAAGAESVCQPVDDDGIPANPITSGVFFEDDFQGGDLSKWSGTQGSAVSWRATEGLNGGPAVRFDYEIAGTAPYVLRKNIESEQLQEFYVWFRFKESDNHPTGCKFLKIFGSNIGTGYANCTAGMTYSNGKHKEISFGDGSATVNDTQATIRFNGSLGGQAFGSGISVDASTGDWFADDGNWHIFELHMKYNDDGLANGLYEVWLDDELKLAASNVINRNDANTPYPAQIGIGGYLGETGAPWSLHFDEVIFSTGRVGGP